MQILNSLYPYPVLSSIGDDYKSTSVFTVEYTLSNASAFKKAKLKVNFQLQDRIIQNLITEGKATVFIHIESPRAIYRKLEKVSQNYHEIEIDPDLMRTSVEITAFILLTSPISQFSNENVNPDLYGPNYIFPDLEIGNPLAVAATIQIELSEIDDFVHVASIIKVAQTTEQLMKVDYDQDIIFVYLPKKQYLNYVNFPAIFGEVMLTSIIFPSIVYVLDAIAKNKGEGMQDRQWYQVIEKKLELLGYSMNQLFNEDISIITLAQEILENPFERMFSELEGMDESND